MLARRLTTILPDMTLAEAIETTRIHRVAGLTNRGTTFVTTRPFRAPHQTISDVGLIGGGHIPMPGRCHWRTTACACSMSSRNAAGMSWKCDDNPWTRGCLLFPVYDIFSAFLSHVER